MRAFLRNVRYCTKQTFGFASHMSAFGSKAGMFFCTEASDSVIDALLGKAILRGFECPLSGQ